MSLTSLLDACRRLGITPDSFEGLPPGADIERVLLEEAIRLRDADQSALSLTLLDLAVAHGFSSGWVDDNRARALLDLGRRDEARSLWLALHSHVDLTLRAVADRMLLQLKQDEQLPLFLAQVQDLADQHQWTLERVSDQQTSSPDVEFALLEEVILAREKGALSLSLELVDLALQAGFSSPWHGRERRRRGGGGWEGTAQGAGQAAAGADAVATRGGPPRDACAQRGRFRSVQCARRGRGGGSAGARAVGPVET